MGVPYFRYSRISTKLDTHTEDVGTTAIVRRAHGDWEGSDRVVPTDVARSARIADHRYLRRASNGQFGQLLLVDGVPGVSMAIEKRALTASKAVKADR